MALAKVGLLALKTAAKPVTKWVGRRCETSQRFRDLCIWVAEFQHTNTARLNHKFELPRDRRGSPRTRMYRPPRKLDEEEAVKLGATIMVELSAMGVAVACIGVDQLWNAQKKRAEKAERANMRRRLETLEAQYSALQAQCESMQSKLSARPAVFSAVSAAVSSAQSALATSTSSKKQATGLRTLLDT
jgi:hypothetical protein